VRIILIDVADTIKIFIDDDRHTSHDGWYTAMSGKVLVNIKERWRLHRWVMPFQ